MGASGVLPPPFPNIPHMRQNQGTPSGLSSVLILLASQRFSLQLYFLNGYLNTEFKPRPRTLWVLDKVKGFSSDLPGLGTERAVIPAAPTTMTGDSKDLTVHL